MNITRLTTPAQPPVSNAQLAEWIRIDTDQDQLTVDMLLASATMMVETTTNTILAPTDVRIEFDCVACSYELPVHPLSQVTAVEVDGVALDPAGWSVRCGRLILTDRPASPPVVFATAGWSAVPAPLAYAIAILVAAGYDSRSEVTPATLKTVEALCAPHRRLVL